VEVEIVESGRHFIWRRSVLPVVAGSALLAAVAVAGSGGTGAEPAMWLDAPGYEATVDDHGEKSGLVFTSSDYQELLVVPDGGASAYIFRLQPMEVVSIPRPAAKITDEGAVLSLSTDPVVLGTFSRELAEIQFDAGNLRIRLGPKPDLVGEVTLDTILARKPGYKNMAASYQPDKAAISEIKARTAPAEILVFFGTWCHVCSMRLPLFLKTMSEAANPNIRIRYVAIDEKYSEPVELLKAYKVRITPTFVVLSGGEEIGRIERKPRVSLERDLADILRVSP
jgi:thiol-disulfide isomerase/thioredoxin